MRFSARSLAINIAVLVVWTGFYSFWLTRPRPTTLKLCIPANVTGISTPTKNISTPAEAISAPKIIARRKSPIIDMVNDYQPYVDFKFVYPETVPAVEETQDLFLIVLVNSGAKGDQFRKRRNTIRGTWGSQRTCEQSRITDAKIAKLKWSLVFVMGKAGEGTDDDERNKEEAKKYNDMIIGDIEDNYLNNIVKFYMGQLWVSSMMTVKYILKTDDDVYVRIPRVLEHLANEGFPKKYYGGAKYGVTGVDRTLGGKWAVSRKYYPESSFPPFNPGAYFILSTDLLKLLFHYVHVRKPFHTDDAYIGVAMRDLKIAAIKIESFSVTLYEDIAKLVKKRTNCETLKAVGVGHDMKPELLVVLHDRHEKLCRLNITVNSCA